MTFSLRRPLTATGLAGAALALSLGAVPAAHASTIAAVSWNPGRIDVFQRNATTGHLETSFYAQSRNIWTPWSDLGETIQPGSDIAAVTRGSSMIDVFFRDTSNVLRRKSWAGSAWPASTALSSATFNGGPTAVSTPSSNTVQILGRNATDGTLLRLTWTPSTDAVTAAYSNLGVSTGTGPGASTTNGSLVQTAISGNDASTNTTPYFLSLDTAGTIPWDLYAQRATLPSKIKGSPAVTSQSSGATTITTRDASGNLIKLSRATPTSPWPASWTTLAAPPANQNTAAAPATFTYKATSTAPETVETILPASNGTQLLLSDNGTGWSTYSPTPSRLSAAAGDPGVIRYFGRTAGTEYDDGVYHQWLTDATAGNVLSPANRMFMNQHEWRLHDFTPESDSVGGWFSGGMQYSQLYTVPSSFLTSHPTWVMRKADGTPLYANDHGTDHSLQRTLLAGNIFNADYRAWAVSNLVATVNDASLGYKGLWLDNVNITLFQNGLVDLYGYEVGQNAAPAVGVYSQGGKDCAGNTTTDPKGIAITDACWASGIATMVEQIRGALLPGKELLTNVPWLENERDPATVQYVKYPTDSRYYMGGIQNSAAQRITAATTYVDLEHGFWNGWASGEGAPGTNALTGNSSGPSSLDMMFRLMDAAHALGKGVIDDYLVPDDGTDASVREREYEVSAYLIGSNGLDGIGEYSRRSAALVNGNYVAANWPAIPGSLQGIYDLDVGTAAPLPAGIASSGAGPTSRGVVQMADLAHGLGRLWMRKYISRAGAKVYVLLNEPNFPGQPVGPQSYQLPSSNCTDLTRPTSQPAYATVTTGGAVYLENKAAIVVSCTS